MHNCYALLRCKHVCVQQGVKSREASFGLHRGQDSMNMPRCCQLTHGGSRCHVGDGWSACIQAWLRLIVQGLQALLECLHFRKLPTWLHFMPFPCSRPHRQEHDRCQHLVHGKTPYQQHLVYWIRLNSMSQEGVLYQSCSLYQLQCPE